MKHGTSLSLAEVVERAIAADPARRRLLLGGLGAATLPFLAGLSACSTGRRAAERMLGFDAVGTSSGDAVVVPAGYRATPFVPWGTPISATAPAWQADASGSAADQEQQVGDNHDGIHYFPLDAAGSGPGRRSDEGLLVMNHEYVNVEYFYPPGDDATDWLAPFTAEKARKAQAGHGVSVLHVRRRGDGWEHVPASRLNRRIHVNTPMTLQGPAAGHALVRTDADPVGTEVLGTLNNCGSGRTPWGTYLTCEENFDGYFGWNGAHTPTALERRYGITSATGFGARWHPVDPRFDVGATPNEPNRFGWVVEIDPFDPASQPVKRTALGRFKHENAACVVAGDGRIVVYMGDDERNEYIYKFVSAGTFDSRTPRSAANRKLLADGTLYVARFDAGATTGDHMGTGIWLPLVFGHNGLTPANGFTGQGDVVIRARQAADRVGATMMDRPEWVAANPNNPAQAYVTLTNDNRRGGTTSNDADGTTKAGSARPPVDEANPRPNNVWGHIVRFTGDDDDAAGATFSWDIFVLAGQPGIGGARAPSANVNAGNLFNSPDGLAFDDFGRLWIQTDGNTSNRGEFAGMGNNQMLAADPQTKEIRRFLVGPSGSEITGITWTPDRTTMFVNIQHPGEVGHHPNKPAGYAGDNWMARHPTSFSRWPEGADAQRPRSATVVVQRDDGGVIGG